MKERRPLQNFFKLTSLRWIYGGWTFFKCSIPGEVQHFCLLIFIFYLNAFNVKEEAACIIGKDYPAPMIDHDRAVSKNTKETAV